MDDRTREIIKSFYLATCSLSMTEEERISVRSQLCASLEVDINVHPEYLYDLLEGTFLEKKAFDVEYLLFLITLFCQLDETYIDLLCSLLEADWHYCHEDIALTFEFSLPSPRAVDCLYRVAIREPPEYLNYSDAKPLAIKCVWALAVIHTEEAKRLLELLAESGIDVVMLCAAKRLSEWDDPYYVTTRNNAGLQ